MEEWDDDNDVEERLANTLLEIKWKSGKSFSQIAVETGLTNVYVAQLLRRQAQLKPETAINLQSALPELSQELVDKMMNPPMLRTHNPDLIHEPTVYRLNEAVMQCGESIKEIIDEEFGDGVMSGIDFYCLVDKIKGTDGKDRVVVRFEGKYMPFPEDVDEDSPPIPPPPPIFQINEATIEEIQLAFQRKELTSKQLLQHYLNAIKHQQNKLRAVIEVNPDAITQAEKADHDREISGDHSLNAMNMMHGIPVLLKDNIGTKDKLNTTCGSYALLDSVVPGDAWVVEKLRQAGAIILGKAGLSEWANFRSSKAPDGWSARGGTVENPYVLDESESAGGSSTGSAGGSSTGSAVSVAANLVSVSLGTETSGSIMSPCNSNCVVGIKPTVGLTSRSGVIPLTLRQDTVGPIGRTVADAVYLLDVIVGSDPRDEVTIEAAKYIPPGGYKQFLKMDGLKGKRLGNMWSAYENVYGPDSPIGVAFQRHADTMSRSGAVLVNFEITPNFISIMTDINDITVKAFFYEFKRDLNIYLSSLTESKVRSLADVIAYNEANPELENFKEYGHDLFVESEKTKLPSEEHTDIVSKLEKGAKEVFETFMIDKNLDAIFTPDYQFSEVLAVLGCPAINVPAGFDGKMPFGFQFGGLKGSEGKLIEIAYAFEQATKVRKPPTLAAA